MIVTARDRIAVMLSGVPRAHRGQRVFMVFQAYIDNSYDKHVHVLAGFIATANAWMDFSDEWQAGLLNAGLQSFKMSEGAYCFASGEISML